MFACTLHLPTSRANANALIAPFRAGGVYFLNVMAGSRRQATVRLVSFADTAPEARREATAALSDFARAGVRGGSVQAIAPTSEEDLG